MRDALARFWKSASPDLRDWLALLGITLLTAAAEVSFGRGASLAVLGAALFYLGVFHGRRTQWRK